MKRQLTIAALALGVATILVGMTDPGAAASDGSEMNNLFVMIMMAWFMTSATMKVMTFFGKKYPKVTLVSTALWAWMFSISVASPPVHSNPSPLSMAIAVIFILLWPIVDLINAWPTNKEAT